MPATPRLELPCAECGGRCCTYPVFTRGELRQAVKAAGGLPEGAQVKHLPGGGRVLTAGPESKWCPFLVEGRCSVYEVRPRACRVYGRIPELPCEYLYPKEAERRALLRAERLGLGFLKWVGWTGYDPKFD